MGRMHWKDDFRHTKQHPGLLWLGEPTWMLPNPLSSPEGIVNLTTDTLIPEILLDILLRKIKGLADQKSSVLPIYRGFPH